MDAKNISSTSSVYTCHDGSQGEMNAFGLLLWCSRFCIFAALAPFTPLFTATGILRHVVPLISGLEGIRSLFELGKAGKVYPWAQFEVGLWAVLPNEWTRYRGDLLLGWKINIKGMNKNSKTPWFSWEFHCRRYFIDFLCTKKTVVKTVVNDKMYPLEWLETENWRSFQKSRRNAAMSSAWAMAVAIFPWVLNLISHKRKTSHTLAKKNS